MIDSLNYFRLNVDISTPSMIIRPSYASNNLSNDIVIVDFPAPVLPTTPIFSLGLISRVTSLIANGKLSLYLTAR